MTEKIADLGCGPAHLTILTSLPPPSSALPTVLRLSTVGFQPFPPIFCCLLQACYFHQMVNNAHHHANFVPACMDAECTCTTNFHEVGGCNSSEPSCRRSYSKLLLLSGCLPALVCSWLSLCNCYEFCLSKLPRHLHRATRSGRQKSAAAWPWKPC